MTDLDLVWFVESIVCDLLLQAGPGLGGIVVERSGCWGVRSRMGGRSRIGGSRWLLFVPGPGLDCPEGLGSTLIVAAIMRIAMLLSFVSTLPAGCPRQGIRLGRSSSQPDALVREFS